MLVGGSFTRLRVERVTAEVPNGGRLVGARSVTTAPEGEETYEVAGLVEALEHGHGEGTHEEGGDDQTQVHEAERAQVAREHQRRRHPRDARQPAVTPVVHFVIRSVVQNRGTSRVVQRQIAVHPAAQTAPEEGGRGGRNAFVEVEELEDEGADGRCVDAEESGEAVALKELAIGDETLGFGAVAQRGHRKLLRLGGAGEARDVTLDKEKTACEENEDATWATAAIAHRGRQKRN